MRINMMTTAVLGMAFSLSSLHSYAQSETLTPEDATTESTTTNRPFAVSLLVGTAGFGLEVKREIVDNITLRLGGNILPVSFTRIETLGNVTVEGFYKARFNNIHLMADYSFMPFKDFTMRGTAGLGVFTKAKVDAHLVPVGSYPYGGGDIELNDGNSDANVHADWKGVAPYLGIGFGKAIPSNKLNISVDLGTYYFANNARVDMETRGYLMGNEIQRKQIQDNLKGYKWLPTLQLSINYKL